MLSFLSCLVKYVELHSISLKCPLAITVELYSSHCCCVGNSRGNITFRVLETYKEAKPYQMLEVHRDLNLRGLAFRFHPALNNNIYNLEDFLHYTYSATLKFYLNILVCAGVVSGRLTLMFCFVHFLQ